MSNAPSRELTLVATSLCRELRKKETQSEATFWNAVRNRRFMGCKFYRQHPLFFDILGKETFFIADFYCHEARLVVEIDGGVHELQEEYDALRTEVINTLGIGVLRFPNELVDSDLPAGLETLKKHLTSEGIGRSDLASIGTHPKSLS